MGENSTWGGCIRICITRWWGCRVMSGLVGGGEEVIRTEGEGGGWV